MHSHAFYKQTLQHNLSLRGLSLGFQTKCCRSKSILPLYGSNLYGWCLNRLMAEALQIHLGWWGGVWFFSFKKEHILLDSRFFLNFPKISRNSVSGQRFFGRPCSGLRLSKSSQAGMCQ